jgi:serine/threonine protein kinase
LKRSRLSTSKISCIQVQTYSIFDAQLIHVEDIKSDNIFVNLQDISLQAENNRFIDVQLGDLGGCYPADSKWATSGTLTGTPIWSSPEVIFEQPWNTAADIWSFGTLVRIATVIAYMS